MNEQEKELAAKIFDHFFEKAKISKLIIFPKISDNHDFGLNCIINNAEHFLTFNASIFLAATFTAMHKSTEIGTRCNDMIGVNELSNNVSQWPMSLKIAVIEECLKRNINLYATLISENLGDEDMIMNVVVVPAARSLEELAIKMELES